MRGRPRWFTRGGGREDVEEGWTGGDDLVYCGGSGGVCEAGGEKWEGFLTVLQIAANISRSSGSGLCPHCNG